MDEMQYPYHVTLQSSRVLTTMITTVQVPGALKAAVHAGYLPPRAVADVMRRCFA